MNFEMNNSKMSPAWIEAMCKKYPIKKITANGEPTGNYLTCPVRLSFPNIFERGEAMDEGGQGKYGATLLFPPGVDISLLKAASQEALLSKWGENARKMQNLRPGMRQQAEKLQFAGYTEGGIFIPATSDKQRPYCVDASLAAIHKEDGKVYPGAWVLATIRPFVYDQKVNKGCAFGLQGIMVIADDENLGGGVSNPLTDFAGVEVDVGAAQGPAENLFD